MGERMRAIEMGGGGGERDNECPQGGGLLGFGVGEVPAAVGLLVSW